jgi:hypothetical protein
VPAVIICVNAEAGTIEGGRNVVVPPGVFTQPVSQLHNSLGISHRPLIEGDLHAKGVVKGSN